MSFQCSAYCVRLKVGLLPQYERDNTFSASVLLWQSSSKAVYVFDVVFCQLVVVTSNILAWRGMWNVFDAFLFPENMLLSDLVSLVVGYLLSIQIFLLQWPAGQNRA